MKVCKEGVEFQFASKRIESLKPRVTMYGAWIKTIYNSDSPQYKASSISVSYTHLTHHRLMKILLFRAQGSSLECFRENYTDRSTELVKVWFTAVSYTHLDVYKRQPNTFS